MTDDVLSRATSALRELGGEPDASQRFTRARVMASLHRRRRTRQSRLYVLVPLAALLIGSTAAGAVSGSLPRAWSVLSGVVAPASAPARASEATSKALAAPRRALPKTRAPDSPRAEPPAPSEEPQSEPPQNEPPHAISPPAAEPPRERANRAVDDRGHALYRSAHQAHFVAGDAAQALRAWDAYLSHAPGGRVALEARYNRAICLVRLGRNAEARAALEAFAAGTYGSYRQSDARSLLDALETRD